MLSAMQISREAVGHVLLTGAIDDATEAVRAGEPLAQPLAECGLFADDVAEMIAVGESANNLPVVLIAIAETIEKRVDRMLALFVRWGWRAWSCSSSSRSSCPCCVSARRFQVENPHQGVFLRGPQGELRASWPMAAGTI